MAGDQKKRTAKKAPGKARAANKVAKPATKSSGTRTVGKYLNGLTTKTEPTAALPSSATSPSSQAALTTPDSDPNTTDLILCSGCKKMVPPPLLPLYGEDSNHRKTDLLFMVCPVCAERGSTFRVRSGRKFYIPGNETVPATPVDLGTVVKVAGGILGAVLGLPPGYQRNPSMICPHCQTKGTVMTKPVKRKTGISGAKVVGGLLTGGISLFATGLSRKEPMTEAYCGHCRTTWHIY